MTKGSNLELFAKVLENLSGDVKDEFKVYVEKYEAKNKAVAEKRANKRAEADTVLVEAITKVLSETPMTRDAILAEINASGLTEVGGKKITAQKITTVMSDLVEAGKAVDSKIKDGKSKKVAYTIA